MEKAQRGVEGIDETRSIPMVAWRQGEGRGDDDRDDVSGDRLIEFDGMMK